MFIPSKRALGDNYFSSIKANGIVLDVLGQKLTGNIDISPYEQGLNKGVKVNLSNGLGSFGVEGNEALVIEEAIGELTILNGQTSAVFSGALRFDLPKVSAAGNFDLNLDTAIGKVEIAGSEVSLKIADQILNGDFIFKNNNDVTQLNIENGSVDIGSGYIVAENISGDLLIDKSGVAGFLNVAPTFKIPGVVVTANEASIKVNSSPLNRDLSNNGILSAGPYLRVDVEGASLALTGLTSNGVGAELSGDFAFEQSGGVTKVGMNNVTVSVEVSGSAGSLEQGKGAMLVTESGVAGTLEGQLVGALEGRLVLRFNNTGSVVDQTLKVGGESVGITFSDTEDVFLVSLLGGSLNIGDVVTIEGNVTFYSKGDYKVFAGENMTLFVGEGPLNKDGARNPGAKGLLVSEAIVGLVKQGEGDAAKYALSAEGQVSVVGISGLSLSGPISISYNGFDQLIDEAVAIAGTTKRVAVKYTEAQVSKVVNGVKEAFYEIKGFETPIAIDVAGQRVRANSQCADLRVLLEEMMTRWSLV